MKLPGRTAKKQVLGVAVDGTDLRIAQLGWENGEIAIYALETIALPTRLGKLSSVGSGALLEEKAGDVFGFDEDEPDADPMDLNALEDEEAGDLSNTLMNVFSKYPLRRTKIAVNIPEGQATYYSFESDFGLKGKKLLKRLNEEISPLTGGTMDSATIDYFRTEDGGLTVVVSEGQIPLIEQLLDIRNYLAGGTPYFCSVNSNEIALINLVRRSLDPPEDKIVALVYIGCDFSRVIILRGGEPLSFIQAIREGYQSPQVCQTLFSKILLEQEEAGIPDIDQIVLAGEIGMTRALDYFQKQFPDAEVKPITPGPLDTSLLKNEELAIFSNFAIPVSLAWEALESKDPRWIKVDLMPHSIRESQKTFKIAWHGFALLGLIFAAMVFLSYQGFERASTIRNLESAIKSKQETIASLQTDLGMISKVQGDINRIKANLEFLTTIVSDPYKWSRLFEKLSNEFKSVNRIWIERIQSTPEGFTMIGKALSRDRIPMLAAGLDGVSLERVTRIISEKGNVVYEFQLTAGLPPPPPEDQPDDAVRTTAVGGDKVSASRGKIPSVTEEQTATKSSSAVKPAPAARVTQPKVTAKPVPEPPQSNASEKATARTAGDLYRQGIELIKAHNVQEALNAFESLVQRYPQSKYTPASHYWIGECYYAMKNYHEAVAAFTRSLDYPKNPKRAAGMLMLGISYQKLGQREEAARYFKKLIEDYPDGEYTKTAERKLQALAG